MRSSPAKALAMIGLGKMGANMSRRLARAGLTVHGFDNDSAARAALASEPGVRCHDSLDAALSALPSPKVVWIMLAAGAVTDEALARVSAALAPGDIVVDGGNANYLDSQQRAKTLSEAGISFVDCGVSGGVHGLENGYCLMLGGSDAAVEHLQTVIAALAPAPHSGWAHCGQAGAGHFSKMVHNGIEYGMMQALAEGFALLNRRDDLIESPAAVANAWQQGSVIRSWLLDLCAAALANPEALDAAAPFVADSGEGRWTVDEAIRQGTPVPVIAASLFARFDSQGNADPANRLLALMRQGFGGHSVRRT
jgi:6-phosphogluconate dehydrogenase